MNRDPLIPAFLVNTKPELGDLLDGVVHFLCCVLSFINFHISSPTPPLPASCKIMSILILYVLIVIKILSRLILSHLIVYL